jgi:hypothetical protein
MRIAALLLAALAAPILPALAQPPEVYKVELTMRDATDASAKSGRHYTILIDTHGSGTFKLGSREPVTTGPSSPGNTPQFTYIDTGVNIDCRLEQDGNNNRLQLRADIDISSILPQKTAVPNPVIGQLKLNVTALVVPGKRTIVASIDDPVSNRKFDVEAFITKVE